MKLKERLYPHGSLSLGVIVLIVSGCSGGSSGNNPMSLDSDSISIVDTTVLPPDTIEPTETVDSNTDAMAMEDASVVVSDGSTATQGTPDEAVINESEAESQTDFQAGSQGETQINPVSPLITRVDFEIMVPAYMSNQLQIDITWGSREIDVQWVGDESWFASEELPTNARLPLVIQFSDLDGDVVLGVHEADFETGGNASEIYVVTAENFNTEGWDDDNDGVSNLSESIAGTNPLIVEGPPLEVRDVYFDDGSFNVVLANVARYESKLIELPYFEQLTEEATDPYESRTYTSRVLTIDVDENGTGTFDDKNTDLVDRGDTTSVDYFATRTNTGDTISYVATRDWWNTGAAIGAHSSISSETEAVDAQSRFQIAELFNRASSGTPFSEYIDYSLTGSIIEGTANCEASHGILSHKNTRFIVQGEERVISISKAVDDQYWYVAKTTPNGGVEEEYFVQNLGRQFYCDLTGL